MGDDLGNYLDLDGFIIGATIMFSKNDTVRADHDSTLGSSENPVLVDQGSSAEVETIGELKRDLPGPRTRDSILSVHNPAADRLWFNRRHSTTQSRGHQGKAGDGEDGEGHDVDECVMYLTDVSVGALSCFYIIYSS